MTATYFSAAVSLGERIKTTNNGYLFAPTPNEAKLAKENPNIFKCTYSPHNNFPYKIELK